MVFFYEKDSNYVQTTDFISFYCFNLNYFLQFNLVDTFIFYTVWAAW